MDGVDPDLVVGAATEVVAGENMIVTAGCIDSHIHFISPQQIYESLVKWNDDHDRWRHGTGNRHNATTCTPGE